MKLNELVNQHFEQLSENDLMIWRYISGNRIICEGITINQLADTCNAIHESFVRVSPVILLGD